MLLPDNTVCKELVNLFFGCIQSPARISLLSSPRSGAPLQIGHNSSLNSRDRIVIESHLSNLFLINKCCASLLNLHVLLKVCIASMKGST